MTRFVPVQTLRVIAWALMRAPNPVPVSQDEERLNRTAQPLAYTVLAERPDPDAGDFKGSFSRTVGAFGAMVLAASLAGISYWIIFDLFEDAGSNLAKLQSTGWYFFVGAALFAPYAFNQLSRIFSPSGQSR